MSTAEERAWSVLRTLRGEGVHVVRQHKIGRYTVDFAIRKLRIAIEIDGDVHDFPGRREADASRQAQLEGIGWRFIRIPAATAYDRDAFMAAIRNALPLPLRGGGRGWGETQRSDISLDDDVLQNGPHRASPHPLTPSPLGEGEALAVEKSLKRRTRANRVLPSRRERT